MSGRRWTDTFDVPALHVSVRRAEWQNGRSQRSNVVRANVVRDFATLTCPQAKVDGETEYPKFPSQYGTGRSVVSAGPIVQPAESAIDVPEIEKLLKRSVATPFSRGVAAATARRSCHPRRFWSHGSWQATEIERASEGCSIHVGPFYSRPSSSVPPGRKLRKNPRWATQIPAPSGAKGIFTVSICSPLACPIFRLRRWRQSLASYVMPAARSDPTCANWVRTRLPSRLARGSDCHWWRGDVPR